MESNIEAYDAYKTLVALDVKPFLVSFNEKLEKRYNDPERARQHRVYELDELESIENDPNLTESEKEFISHLKEVKKDSDRAQQLLNAIEKYFTEAVEDSEINQPINSNEPRAKLRRTAAILYKNAQIPEMNISRGSFKEVSGPIGIDKRE
jgi:hypothetical protein